jgi:hypothetical protein
MVASGRDWSQVAKTRPLFWPMAIEVWKVWGPAILVGLSKQRPPSPERAIR